MRPEYLKTWLKGVKNEEQARENGEEGYEGQATPAASS